MRNDQVGLLVGRLVEQASARLPGNPQVGEFTGSPLDLLGRMVGFRRVVLIDSMVSGRWPPATVVSFTREELLPHGADRYPHGLNVPAALQAAERLGLEIPEELSLIGIEVESLDSFGEDPDPQLTAALPAITAAVFQALEKLLCPDCAPAGPGPP